MLYEYGYESAINKYTREEENSKTCIDHVFVKSKCPRESILPVILEVQITDHYPVIFQYLYTSAPNPESTSNKIKTYTDHNMLSAKFSNENWLDVYNAPNLEESWNAFISIINKYIEICRRNVNLKRREIRRTPWITQALMVS